MQNIHEEIHLPEDLIAEHISQSDQEFDQAEDREEQIVNELNLIQARKRPVVFLGVSQRNINPMLFIQVELEQVYHIRNAYS